MTIDEFKKTALKIEKIYVQKTFLRKIDLYKPQKLSRIKDILELEKVFEAINEVKEKVKTKECSLK